MKLLFVITSHQTFGETDKPTGYWAEELATPYYHFVDKGHQVILASPQGGKPPCDPSSLEDAAQNDDTRRFFKDEVAQDFLATTKQLSDVSADDFDGVFYPGGHGPLWDLATNSQSIALIETFAKQGKPVASVCHGPAVLINTRNQAGDSLLKGEKVTGFSNQEEAAVGLTKMVPFLLEDAMKEKGAVYAAGPDWEPHVVTGETFITGQNPGSSKGVAEALLLALKK